MSKKSKTVPVELPGGEDDFIWIGRDVYVKRPEALPPVLEAFRKIGYEVDDSRKADHREGVTVDQMEKEGWSLWYVHLPSEIRVGKCGSCKKYIASAGIQSHKHKCEKCGAYTYLQIVDGTRVRFSFRSEERRSFAPDLMFKAHSWESDTGSLYLYPEPLESRGYFVLSGEKAQACLQRCHKDWEAVEKDGKRLIRVQYHEGHERYEENSINMMDILGSQYNHLIVKLWGGKEYSEYEQLPIPDSIHIYEAWHWAPLASNPRLHARMLSAIYMPSNQDFYYQDGRPIFSQYHVDELAKFVKHFTTLDYNAFLKWRFRMDGPGFIEDLACFCHESPEIENNPNIGNVLTAVGKMGSGQTLTAREVAAAEHGLTDPENRAIASELLAAVSENGATKTANTAAKPQATKRRNGLLGLLSRIWK